MWQRLFILFAVSIIVEIIVYLGLRKHFRSIGNSYLVDYFKIIHWAIPIGLLLYFFGHLLIVGYPELDYKKYRSYFVLFGIFVLFFLPRFVFMISVILQAFLDLFTGKTTNHAYRVKRKQKQKLIIQKIGIVLSIISFLGVFYGMIWGKKDFHIKEVNLQIDNLPESFEGMRILQFSDAHLGSFLNTENAKKGLELIAAQDVDLVVFTGDMINNLAYEMEDYVNELKSIEAKYGKYSILGNHDVGDYVQWNDVETKEKHIRLLKNYTRIAGFDLLLNQNIFISNGIDSIALIGVENWGLPPFKQYGDLSKAMQNLKKNDFKILLSHDPSHWRADVLPNSNVALTLSGHTHGMQFGIDCCGIKWSPSKFIYPEWNGLYVEENQFLYVNPGFGFIGFPGRVGIRPQITIFNLYKSTDNE
jgi:predicted MPP superfamily phosphohydrolase